MSRFEDRLWQELVEQHGALLLDPPPASLARPQVPLRARPWAIRRRLPIAALGTALAAGLAALVIGLGGGGSGTPAYAVTSNPDGTVTVTIRELVGIEGANGRLAALGIPVRVVTVEAGCPAPGAGSTPDRLPPDAEHAVFAAIGPSGSASVKLTPARIPSGDTLVLGAKQLSAGQIALSGALYKGPGRDCLPLEPGR